MLVTWIAFALIQAAEPEPSVVFKTFINDTEYLAEEDVPLRINTAIQSPATIRVVSTQQRLFRYGDMRFRYPARFRFQSDHELSCMNWELHGRITSLEIYIVPLTAEVFLQTYVDNFVLATEDKLQKPQLKTSKVTIDGRELRAFSTRIQISSDDFYEFYVVELSPLDEKTRLLLFDIEYEDGSVASETTELKTTVLDTLTF